MDFGKIKGNFKDFRGLLGNQEDDRNGFFLNMLYRSITEKSHGNVGINASTKIQFDKDDYLQIFLKGSYTSTNPFGEWTNYLFDIMITLFAYDILNKTLVSNRSKRDQQLFENITKNVLLALNNIKAKITAPRDEKIFFLERVILLLFESINGINVSIGSVINWNVEIKGFMFRNLIDIRTNINYIFEHFDDFFIATDYTVSNLNAKIANITRSYLDPTTNVTYVHFDFTDINDTSRKNFTFAVDKYIYAKLMNVGSPKMYEDTTSFLDEPDSIDGQRFYRKLDNLDKLYTLSKDGVEIEVQLGSPTADAVFSTPNKMCEVSGLKLNHTDCADFFTKCIIDGGEENIENCKIYLQGTDFWARTKDEIQNMIPQVAVQILQKFGLNTISMFDNTANMMLLKFQSYSSWIKELKDNKQVTPAEYDNIQKNDKLEGYISLVVEFVNSSPAILNVNYAGVSDEGCISHPKEFEGTRLRDYGLFGRKTFFPATYNQGLQTLNLIRNNQQHLIKLRGYPGGLMMVGGGPAVTQVPKVLKNYSKVAASHILRNTFNSFRLQLERKNKKLNGSDIDKIEKLLIQLKNSESKLIKAFYLLEKYNDNFDSFANNDPNKFFNMHDLEIMQNKKDASISKVSNRQGNLISILETILNAVGDAEESQ
jgi:hypothetical protein